MLKTVSKPVKNLNSLGLSVVVNSEAQIEGIAKELAELIYDSFGKAPAFKDNKDKYLNLAAKLGKFKNLDDFKSHLLPWPKSVKEWELPKELNLFLDDSLENLFVFKKSFDALQPLEDDLLFTILSDESLFETPSEFDEPYENDSFQGLRKCDLWLFILANYAVKGFHVRTANLATYGTPNIAKREEATHFLQSMGFTTDDSFLCSNSRFRFDINDSPDDCCNTIGITLVKN